MLCALLSAMFLRHHAETTKRIVSARSMNRLSMHFHNSYICSSFISRNSFLNRFRCMIEGRLGLFRQPVRYLFSPSHADFKSTSHINGSNFPDHLLPGSSSPGSSPWSFSELRKTEVLCWWRTLRNIPVRRTVFVSFYYEYEGWVRTCTPSCS